MGIVEVGGCGERHLEDGFHLYDVLLVGCNGDGRVDGVERVGVLHKGRGHRLDDIAGYTAERLLLKQVASHVLHAVFHRDAAVEAGFQRCQCLRRVEIDGVDGGKLIAIILLGPPVEADTFFRGAMGVENLALGGKIVGVVSDGCGRRGCDGVNGIVGQQHVVPPAVVGSVGCGSAACELLVVDAVEIGVALVADDGEFALIREAGVGGAGEIAVLRTQRAALRLQRVGLGVLGNSDGCLQRGADYEGQQCKRNASEMFH